MLQQLNEKSVFSFTNNVLNIDFNGDGVFDTQINCLMNNGNIVGCHSQEPKNQDLAQSLNSWLKNNYGDYQEVIVEPYTQTQSIYEVAVLVKK